MAALAGDAPLRSAGALLPTSASVYVADSIGEMGLWYRLAPIALVLLWIASQRLKMETPERRLALAVAAGEPAAA